ncbi:hypothetical protein [Microcoleus sp. S13_B4]|uniref:hypothetical protein n=1 Tax=Microcoleus sp. S13_B4 TaxID=3055408 RepID=UPI002FCF04DB
MNLQKTEGNLQSKPRAKPQFSPLKNAEPFVKALVAEHPDATLVELCELFAHQSEWKLGEIHGNVSAQAEVGIKS